MDITKELAANGKCLACIHLTEIGWHILSFPSRSFWRKELLRTLGETLTTYHTQLDLALILLQMNPNNSEPIFRALVNLQNSILG